MGTYNFKWRRLLRSGKSTLWTTEKKLRGHEWNKDTDKMLLFFEDGSMKEIPQWNSCGVFLGTDFVEWTKENMEKEAQQPIKLNVNAGGQ